jgi:hypothetical protein
VADRWNGIAGDSQFATLYAGIEHCFTNSPELKKIADEFAAFQGHRTGWNMNDETRLLEQKYLFSEVAMSIFMTECRGFCCEVWERDPAGPGPDPLGYLYSNFRAEISAWTGNSEPCRTLYRLPSDW